MATQSVQPGCAPANPIVTAFLVARAKDTQIDQSDEPNDSVEARMAQFASAGARDYAMAWSIKSDDHGALVALIAADRLDALIENYSLRNDRGQKVLTFGIEELHEVRQIKDALLNLWRHLDPGPRPALRPLALDLHLIDELGNAID